MIKQGVVDCPSEPETPPYVYKYPHLGVRDCYEGVFEDSYWHNWSMNPYTHEVLSWISWWELEKECNRVGYTNLHKMSRAKSILLNGASLACEGTGRLPTEGKNSKSVYENGRKFADQLHHWVQSGIVFGPLRRVDLPLDNIKIAPMGVAPKPGGKIRIVMDLSYPHGISKDDPRPNSVNSGIDKQLLSSKMSTTRDVIRRIWRYGRDTEFCKADWTDAYKHVSVQDADRGLQVFSFGGRLFVESQMTFGASSSPDRFDLVSDIPLECALLETEIWKESIIKVLDDSVCFGQIGTGVVGKFYTNFRNICSRVGIRLASDEDETKAFGPRREGIVLGIWYHLPSLMCAIPGDKADRILILLWEAKATGCLTYERLSSLIGKITHYMPLVKFGKFERSFMLKYVDTERPPWERIHLDEEARNQSGWWIRSMGMAKQGVRIPDPGLFKPRVYVELCPDASGGGGSSLSGAGSCFMTSSNQPWLYLNWPKWLIMGKTNSLGIRFSRKLSTLEAVAGLLGFTSEPDLVRNKHVVIRTDNIGFVYAFENGTSTCLYLHSVCKALDYVAKALNATLAVEKVYRRSGTGAVVADELSKGRVSMALNHLPDPMEFPSRVSRTISNWIMDPVPTRQLGERIVDELATFTSILEWGQF